MDIMFNGKWLEVNGAGLVNPIVLKNFGLDPEIYNGWAFGFGDRLAMIKMGIPIFAFCGQKSRALLASLKI